MTTLLAADVGNTNVVLGAYEGAKLLSTWRTATRSDQTEDELAVMVDALLGREDLSLDDVDALVLGSVVPPLTASAENAGAPGFSTSTGSMTAILSVGLRRRRRSTVPKNSDE